MSGVNETPERRVRGYTLEQPRALVATLRALPAQLARVRQGARPARRVLLVGSGTSKNALIATAPAFARAHRASVSVLGPLEALADDADLGGALVVVVSQTGSSTTSVAALEALQARAARAGGARVLALTAEPTSAFGRAAAHPITLAIGPEPIGPKTKGYTASLAALLALADATAGASGPATLDDPAAFGAWFAGRLPAWDALGAAWAERWHAADHVMVIGAGRHVGTALEATLKLQEMAGMPASAFDLEEALHGRFHGLGPRSLAVFVVGEAAHERLAADAARVLGELGVGALVVATGAEASPEGDAFARLDARPPGGGAGAADLDLPGAIVPFQVWAEHAARLRGVDPDAMRYPGMSQRLGIKLPAGG